MEQLIEFNSPDGILEGLYKDSNSDKAVAITHPHPLYGGDMYNSVVEVISNAFNENGYTTLRFNFRGVGNSQGHFDNGVGEQEDVLAAVEYLTKKGYSSVELAGYSFGSWVLYQLLNKGKIQNPLTLVSPPIDFIQFDDPLALSSLKLVITGDRDDFASESKLKELVSTWNDDSEYQVVKGGDHFYSGYLDRLQTMMIKAISRR